MRRIAEHGSFAKVTYAERTQGHLGLTRRSRIPEPFSCQGFAPVAPAVSIGITILALQSQYRSRASSCVAVVSACRHAIQRSIADRC